MVFNNIFDISVYNVFLLYSKLKKNRRSEIDIINKKYFGKIWAKICKNSCQLPQFLSSCNSESKYLLYLSVKFSECIKRVLEYQCIWQLWITKHMEKNLPKEAAQKENFQNEIKMCKGIYRTSCNLGSTKKQNKFTYVKKTQ